MFERLKTLFAHTTVYGMGDVAPSLLSLLLLPIFTRYLTTTEYGVIALLLTVEAGTKVLFRWGVDSAFMRLFYDCKDLSARQRLSSSIFLYLLAANGVLLVIGLLAAPRVAAGLLGTTAHTGTLRLVIVNTFIIAFLFHSVRTAAHRETLRTLRESHVLPYHQHHLRPPAAGCVPGDGGCSASFSRI